MAPSSRLGIATTIMPTSLGILSDLYQALHRCMKKFLAVYLSDRKNESLLHLLQYEPSYVPPEPESVLPFEKRTDNIEKLDRTT